MHVRTRSVLCAAVAAAAARVSEPVWTGLGITSSIAAANPDVYAVGIATAAKLGLTTSDTFFGESITDVNNRLIRLTYIGDTNLDGAITPADYTNIDAGYNANSLSTHTANDAWFSGDFNYDTYVGLDDYLPMDQVYALTHPGHNVLSDGILTTSSPFYTERLAAVPEPTGLAVLGALATAGPARRRRPS